MTESQSATGHESANKLYNAGGRKEAIGRAMEECYKLDKEIDAVVEREVAPLRRAKSDIKAKLKDDYQLTVKAFNVRYGAFKFERQARDNGDQVTLDLLTELYEIQPVGGALAFMSVQAPKPADAAAARTESAAKANGKQPPSPQKGQRPTPRGLTLKADKTAKPDQISKAREFGAQLFQDALPEPPDQAPAPPAKIRHETLRHAVIEGWHSAKKAHETSQRADGDEEFDELGEIRDKGREAFERGLPDVPEEPPTVPAEYQDDAQQAASWLAGWANARDEHLGIESQPEDGDAAQDAEDPDEDEAEEAAEDAAVGDEEMDPDNAADDVDIE